MFSTPLRSPQLIRTIFRIAMPQESTASSGVVVSEEDIQPFDPCKCAPGSNLLVSFASTFEADFIGN
jgi:hypothetical protein